MRRARRGQDGRILWACALLAAGCGDAVAQAVAYVPSPDAARGDTGADGPPTPADSSLPPPDGAVDAGSEPGSLAEASLDAPLDVAFDTNGCTAEVEPNTDPQHAQVITLGMTCGILRSAGDTDFYTFSFATAGIPVTFSFLAQGDATIVLTIANGAGVDSSSSGGMFTFDSQVGTNQVMVYSATGLVQTYQLTLQY